jgi:ABC-type uncharacterized transport system substrate-binding protein
MRRREFITFLGGAAAAWPLAARAQQRSMPVIGFLNPSSPELTASLVRAFREGLGEIGFVEGRNVEIEYRWAQDQNARLPALAADLVRRQVKVIVVTGTAVFPAKAATTTIPIVFQTASNPVETGLVASLNRPGGNLTGVVTLGVEVAPKRLELMRELFPTATSLALLVNPTDANTETLVRELQVAARTLGLQLHVLSARAERDFEKALASLRQLGAGGLVLGAGAFISNRSVLLADLTLSHAVPAISPWRDFAAAGGLMSYGGNLASSIRVVGGYTGRILKGEKPADLPVQRATKIELSINMKTAKALGLTFPTAILVRADEVIE